jgi:hypothetical protein
VFENFQVFVLLAAPRDKAQGYLAATSQALNEPDEEEEDVHSGTNKQLK